MLVLVLGECSWTGLRLLNLEIASIQAGAKMRSVDWGY